MSPGAFTNFFLASAGAGAALVGLLFVAVSVAPEQPFAPGSAPERRGVATAAFIALANAFFVSLASHGIGLGRAWELLGAPRRGLLAWMSPLYELNRTTPADHTDGKAAAPQKPPEKAT